MSGVEVLHRKSEYVVEWAEHPAESPPDDEPTHGPDLAGVVRFRIEGVRRIEPWPVEPIDPEAMLGEPPF
jgi:hypothetical protein